MSERNSVGVLDRTLGNLRRAWREIAGSARGVLTGVPRPDLSDDDAARLRQQMLSCLDSQASEVTVRARAADLGRTYLALNPAGRLRFLRLLADEFDVDHDAVSAACGALAAATAPAERDGAERKMRQALTPPRVTLLRQFNALPEGVKFLVDRRAELVAQRGDASLSGLAEDLRELLANWFDIGFLELKRITWEAPAALLEKLMAYEAVHEIRGWTDLKNRVEADRRCFAFFHPRMPDEPLIFVEIALVNGIAGDVRALLDEAAPVSDAGAADTAIFYSISNCQKGLVGISLGDFLIKRVVDALTAELPRLKTFATLSPIPGFRTWLSGAAAKGGGLLSPAETKTLAPFAEASVATPEDTLLHLIDMPGWQSEAKVVAAVKGPLLRLCGRYLVSEQSRPGRALDPVAHFHLSNGARVEQLNWLGDVSERGLRQSAGIMVNYRYVLGDIEANHEAYRGEGKVAAASAVQNLAKGG
ncbi:MAG TPA: malonyl-CoA decarboxylase family protein [Stellaceae bacterium]|jgi:malonyl-CoA decarboxylase|nr:malonyl-CoA decarboxylase family protein [Stellaceae bacterium]